MGTVYRVYAPGVRINRPGQAHLEAMRPFKMVGQERVYTDSDEAPTLVELGEETPPEMLALLLKTGAIAPYEVPPKGSGKRAPKEE